MMAPGFLVCESVSPPALRQTHAREAHLLWGLLGRTFIAKAIKARSEAVGDDADGRYGMKSFLIGLGLGIGLGVLFAPMSGEDTRENLSERANDLANSARESYEIGREKFQRGVEQVRSTAGRAMNQAVRTGTEATNL